MKRWEDCDAHLAIFGHCQIQRPILQRLSSQHTVMTLPGMHLPITGVRPWRDREGRVVMKMLNSPKACILKTNKCLASSILAVDHSFPHSCYQRASTSRPYRAAGGRDVEFVVKSGELGYHEREFALANTCTDWIALQHVFYCHLRSIKI